jgi:hypothetical protein
MFVLGTKASKIIVQKKESFKEKKRVKKMPVSWRSLSFSSFKKNNNNNNFLPF